MEFLTQRTACLGAVGSVTHSYCLLVHSSFLFYIFVLLFRKDEVVSLLSMVTGWEEQPRSVEHSCQNWSKPRESSSFVRDRNAVWHSLLIKGKDFSLQEEVWLGRHWITFFFSALREVPYKCVFHECNSCASDSLERRLVLYMREITQGWLKYFLSE